MGKLTTDQQKLHEEAIAEGYKDETCPKCGTEFLAHIHFIRCDARPCPMSGSGQTLLEMWAAKTDTEASQNETDQRATREPS